MSARITTVHAFRCDNCRKAWDLLNDNGYKSGSLGADGRDFIVYGPVSKSPADVFDLLKPHFMVTRVYVNGKHDGYMIQ